MAATGVPISLFAICVPVDRLDSRLQWRQVLAHDFPDDRHRNRRYRCRRMFPIAAISCHGMSGCRARSSTGMRRLASEMISIPRSTPRRSSQSPSKSWKLFPIRTRSMFAIASRMSCSAGSGLRGIRTRELPTVRFRREAVGAGCPVWSRRSFSRGDPQADAGSPRGRRARIVALDHSPRTGRYHCRLGHRRVRLNRTNREKSRRALGSRRHTPSIWLSLQRASWCSLCRLSTPCNAGSAQFNMTQWRMPVHRPLRDAVLTGFAQHGSRAPSSMICTTRERSWRARP